MLFLLFLHPALSCTSITPTQEGVIKSTGDLRVFHNGEEIRSLPRKTINHDVYVPAYMGLTYRSCGTIAELSLQQFRDFSNGDGYSLIT